MRRSLIGRWVRTGVLSLLVALQPIGAPTARLLAPAIATPALSIAGSVFAPADAWARGSKSSGGYSRPSSSSSSSRTPSASSGGYSRPSTSASAPSRTPSADSASRRDVAPSSGGYSRPGSGAVPDRTSSAARPSGAGDQSFSRQASSDALDRYRSREQADRAPAPAAPASNRASATKTGTSADTRWSDSIELPKIRVPRSTSSSTSGAQPANARPTNDWSRYGWSPPRYATQSAPRFGMWEGMFLWFLLDTLNRPGHAAFFHDNAEDPGVRAWRARAEELAGDNAEMRGKLKELNRAVASRSDEPRNPGRLPGDIPAELARADAADGAGSGGLGTILLVVVLVGGALFLLWFVWRRRGRAAQPAGTPPAGTAKASTTKREKDAVPLFGTFGNYVNQKLSGERYKPSLFRLGMTLTIDPTPFLLAAGVTKVTAPEVSGADQLAGVEAVGTVSAGSATAHRLYLSGGRSFFQIHLDADGQPDECRLFTIIDEITPADESEWAFWLDKAEGMIGWPEFQTKDGKTYQRAWSPGGSRIRPFSMTETVETLQGSRSGTSDAMLYAAPTGAAEPAPETEYILVQAIDQGGRAWIQVAAGIDVNPASLSLA